MLINQDTAPPSDANFEQVAPTTVGEQIVQMGMEAVKHAAKEIVKNATGYQSSRSRAIPIDPNGGNVVNGGGLFSLFMTVARIVIFVIIAVYICK